MAHRRTSEPGATTVDRRPGVADRPSPHQEARRGRPTETRPEPPREDPREEEWRQYIEHLQRDGLLPDGVLYRARIIMNTSKGTDCMRLIHNFVPAGYKRGDPVRKSLSQYRHAASELGSDLEVYASMYRGNPLEFAHMEFARTLAFALFTQDAVEGMTLGIGRRLYQGPDPSLVRAPINIRTVEPQVLPKATWLKRKEELDTRIQPLTEKRFHPNIDSRWYSERPSIDRERREIMDAITTLMSEGLPRLRIDQRGKININPTFGRRDFLTMVRAMAGTDIGSRLLHGAQQRNVDQFAHTVDPNLIQVDGMYFTEQSDPRQRGLRELDVKAIKFVLQTIRVNEERWTASRAEQAGREAAVREQEQQQIAQSFAVDMHALAEASAQEASVRRSMGAGWQGLALKFLDVIGLYPRMKAVRDAKKAALRKLQSPQYDEMRGNPSTLEERAHDLLLATVPSRQLSEPTAGARQENDLPSLHAQHPQQPRQRRET